MPAEHTALEIAAPSRPPIDLPHGAIPHRLGLELPAGLNLQEWQEIGGYLVHLLGATLLWWGDWLAYGQTAYNDAKYAKSLKHGTLDMTAERTGWSRSRLANAKHVCATVNLSRRREELTYSHFEEIAFRVPPTQLDVWLDRAATHHLTVSALREELRTAYAIHKDGSGPRVNADPTAEAMSKVMDFTRYFRREKDKWHPVFKKRVALELADVFEALRDYLPSGGEKFTDSTLSHAKPVARV